MTVAFEGAERIPHADDALAARKAKDDDAGNENFDIAARDTLLPYNAATDVDNPAITITNSDADLAETCTMELLTLLDAPPVDIAAILGHRK